MCLSIEGALNQRKNLKGLMEDDHGNPFTDKEVRMYLKQAQSEGKRVLSMGDCDNFDYQTGCKGHGIVTVVTDIKFEEGLG